MKTKETKKMPLRQKFHNFCADVSTRVLFGGGSLRLLSLFHKYCKISKLCYNGDVYIHKYGRGLLVKKAFTLSEILITLGIIGIVAALTMPAVLANHQKKVLAVQTKRFYSLLSQAYISAELHNGEAANWEGNNNYSATVFEKYIFPELKGISSVDDEILRNNCTDYGYETGLHLMTSFNVARSGCFLLASGELVFPKKVSSDDDDGYYLTGLIVDVNGFKKPNAKGKDIHTFFIIMRPTSKNLNLYVLDGQIKNFHKAGIIPSGYNLIEDCTKHKLVHLCTAKLMQDGWEFKDDYPW